MPGQEHECQQENRFSQSSRLLPFHRFPPRPVAHSLSSIFYHPRSRNPFLPPRKDSSENPDSFAESDGGQPLLAQAFGAVAGQQAGAHGHGMPSEMLRRIGEPFFTTKEPGKGMGLGTFLVRTLAERLGGRLTFESSQNASTTAVLELPVTLRPELVL